MSAYRFVDLFAGCGGFSLGLGMAGLRGSFAVERDPMAFATFKANLIADDRDQIDPFDWPEWLAKEACGIEVLLDTYKEELLKLRGTIDVLAGGPPCQGFSFAGRRNAADPRNMLFEKYVEVVEAIQPQILLLENVPGMQVAHGARTARVNGTLQNSMMQDSHYDLLVNKLRAANYNVEAKLLDAASFGVPQRRTRLIVVGIRTECAALLKGGMKRVFEVVSAARAQQLSELKLSSQVSAKEALSDLETVGGELFSYRDKVARGDFQELRYKGPRTSYQRLMRSPYPPVEMDSMRLARHSAEVSGRFRRIIAECQKGTRMNDEDRAKFGLKKHRIYPMHPGEPAPTITTLPDDVLHYSEPRILSVRECARLQSFPDWFEFHGKYTTGGHMRTKECPRYTQVGNAVPPLMARALGIGLRSLLGEIEHAQRGEVDAPAKAVA